MPPIEVIYYREKADVDAQVLLWLDRLPSKVHDKCIAYVDRLSEFGNDLRRPSCDIVQSPIWELRPTWQGVHYRILYAFMGKNKAVLLHGCTKVGPIETT